MATKFLLLVLLGALTCTSNARKFEMIRKGGVDMEEKFWHHFPHFGGGLGFGHLPGGVWGNGGAGFDNDVGEVVGGNGGGPGGDGGKTLGDRSSSGAGTSTTGAGCGSNGGGGGACGEKFGAGNP